MKALLTLLKEKFKDRMTGDVQTEIEAAYEEDVAEEVSGLKTKNGELIATNKTLRQQLASGGGADATKLVNELEELKDKAAADKNTYDRELAKLTRELDKASKTAKSESEAVAKLVADNGLNEALVASGVKPEFIPAVTAMLRSNVIVNAEGDKRVALMGDKPLGEAVKAWAASDAGKVYVLTPPNGGGGAGGSGAGGTGGAKVVKRADFQRMAPADQQAFIVKDGGKVVD